MYEFQYVPVAMTVQIAIRVKMKSIEKIFVLFIVQQRMHIRL